MVIVVQVLFITYTRPVPPIPLTGLNGIGMKNGTGIRTGTVPVTGRAITGFGTGGTGGIGILRFFPENLERKFFKAFTPFY